MRQVVLPKQLKLNFLTSIINDFNFVFSLEGNQEQNFVLDLEKIQKVDIVGIIILFKFIEYTVSKKCFHKPEIRGDDVGEIAKAIKFYGFEELLKDYIKERNVDKTLLKLQVKEKDSFIVAPQALLRNSPQSKANFDIKLKNELLKFYGSDYEEVLGALHQCSAEISSNFFNHAEEDTKSIILAKGDKKNFEIVCADTAEGIINTLRTNKKYQDYDDKPLFRKAFEKGVTCKPNSNHMGSGLWLAREVTKEYNGRLEVLSSDLNYSIKSGKIVTSKTPFWRGTIFYMKIPITKNGISIAEILRKNRKDMGITINIDFR